MLRCAVATLLSQHVFVHGPPGVVLSVNAPLELERGGDLSDSRGTVGEGLM